jgi:uncharacterized protein involved in exopolysaccharide biosynthesis
MNITGLIKIVLKHKVVLFGIPVLMAAIAILLTRDPKFDYESQAYVYTGIASGSSLEIDKKYNRDNIFTAFDNLISIITSRETKEEVSIRLLTQHLLLDEPKESYISKEHYNELKELVPKEIYNYLVKTNTTKSSDDHPGYIPPGVSKEDFEQSVENLIKLKNSSIDNFIYELLNYEDPVYSIKAISEVSVSRVQSSDVIQLKYKAGDPGICKQTLMILIDVCSKKYREFKENGSDAVVKYFEAQLAKSENKLKEAEKELLEYKQENKIINYYEQSKAVAVVREDMEVAYKNKTAELAGSKASRKKLRDELEVNGRIEQVNEEIFEDKNRLADLRYQIALQEARSENNEEELKKFQALKNEERILTDSINKKINKLYAISNSIDGIPMTRMMPEFIDNMVATENLEAEVELMNQQSKDFLREVEKYAPFGANIKRMERQIRVIEEEYIEILHGLNLAKIKYQDTQIGGNLSIIDPPYFPLNPIPSKRKIIVIAATFLSFILILGTLLVMEFFDETLKNQEVAAEKLKIKPMGMLPKITRSNSSIDLVHIQNRLMDFVMHNFLHVFRSDSDDKSIKPKLITVLSTEPNEGKSVIAGNISRKLKYNGKNVLYLNHSNTEKQKFLSYSNVWFYKILGYQDPRVDYSHPFLDSIESYLDKDEYINYEINDSFTHAQTYKDLTFESKNIDNKNLDFIIVELPGILQQNYPAELLKNSDLAILVCRSNRIWSKADDNILDNIKELIGDDIQFVLNGVAIEEVETLLGEVPKKRSALRKKLKNVFKFQFSTQKQI